MTMQELSGALVTPALDPETAAVLESLGTEGLIPPSSNPVKSITMLAAERRHQGGLQGFRDVVRAIPKAGTQTLILRLATASDPLILWALHLELDRRDLPPCLRWPSNVGTLQHEFITWLADMLWFTKRNPSHMPRFRGWRGLFANSPACAKWHAAAARQFGFVSARYSVAHWCATGLGLSGQQRQDLMALPTGPMQAERRQLAPEHWGNITQTLLSHAMQHPDRSGRHKPEATASRRASLLRVFVLSGRAPTATAKNWHLLTGEHLSRQVVSRQIAITLCILDSPRG